MVDHERHFIPLGVPMPFYNFYGDESGNSGGGFLDPEQPIFVLSLVGWPADREAEVLKEYENIWVLRQPAWVSRSG
jgi:hypothetical protein